jgi:hypothetical protein
MADHNQEVSEEDSKNSSMVPLDDTEKTQLPEPKESAEGNAHGFQRPVKGFKWFLVCVGLYLGAVLYGERLYTILSIPCKQN